MEKKKLNPLAFLGLLGFLGILGFVTGKNAWFGWFGWFAWFGNCIKPTDERFFNNLAKTCSVCFIISLVGIAAMTFMRALSIPVDYIFNVLGILFAIILVSFTAIFSLFERYGA